MGAFERFWADSVTDRYSLRTLQGAPKAQQTLTLVGGGCAAAFDPQLEALANIREVVLRLLSRSDCDTLRDDGKIHLSRRVFDRVSRHITSSRMILT